MGSDELFKRRKEERRKRKENLQTIKSTKWLVVCEGVETEVNYFNSMIEEVNKKLIASNKLKVNIIGAGKNTLSLVNSVENFIGKVDFLSQEKIPYSKIFVVFDKDDFAPEIFDEAIRLCERKEYIPLWSNQAFEYWFLLHFNYVEGKIHRTQYASKLNEYFKSSGLNYKYKKNDKEIFNKLCKYGSLENAIKRAKKIHTSFGDTHPSEQESATTVYKFFNCVEEKIQEFN